MMMILYVNLDCGCEYEISLQQIDEAEVPEGYPVLPGPSEGNLMGCADHGVQQVLKVRTETVSIG